MRRTKTAPISIGANTFKLNYMKVNELPKGANVLLYKLKIPQDGSVKQLGTDKPLEEGFIAGMHSNPGGWWMTSEVPSSKSRRLIPAYGDNDKILEWEIIDGPYPRREEEMKHTET